MNEVFNKMVGQYILERRLERGVSQSELAKQLLFSPQFLGRIEKGAVPIPEEALKKVIVYLDMEKRRFSKIIDYSATWFLEELFNNIENKGTNIARGKR